MVVFAHRLHYLRVTVLFASLCWVSVISYAPKWTRRRAFFEPVKVQQSRSTDCSLSDHFVFPGGGIFFYWQAGFISYLREEGYDEPSTATGASAGALAATLTLTGVDFYRATELALSLAKDAGVWERKYGLQGIWGPMIHDWLDELLPENAVDMLSKEAQEEGESNLAILLTPVPNILGAKERVSRFTCKEDLIQCNMASVHLPWFLDGNLTCKFRNRHHIDGSFLSKPSDYRSDKQAAQIIVHHSLDSKYKEKGLFDFVKAISPSGIYGMLEDGKRYAKSLDEAGLLAGIPKRCDIR